MTYNECLEQLKNYEKFINKKVESEDEIYKVKHALIYPVNKSQFSAYRESYFIKGKSAEVSLTPFINEDLQIGLKAYKLSDDSVALLEPADLRIIG
jgi:hypothetical protein